MAETLTYQAIPRFWLIFENLSNQKLHGKRLINMGLTDNIQGRGSKLSKTNAKLTNHL